MCENLNKILVYAHHLTASRACAYTVMEEREEAWHEGVHLHNLGHH